MIGSTCAHMHSGEPLFNIVLIVCVQFQQKEKALVRVSYVNVVKMYIDVKIGEH